MTDVSGFAIARHYHAASHAAGAAPAAWVDTRGYKAVLFVICVGSMTTNTLDPQVEYSTDGSTKAGNVGDAIPQIAGPSDSQSVCTVLVSVDQIPGRWVRMHWNATVGSVLLAACPAILFHDTYIDNDTVTNSSGDIAPTYRITTTT